MRPERDERAARPEEEPSSPAEPAGRNDTEPRTEEAVRREGWMSAQELLAHVIFSTLLPPAQLTAESQLSLRDLKHLAELAVYKELKSQRLTMKEICERIDVSMGKVGLLSRQLKDHFSRPDGEYGLSRRLLMLLWAGPRTEAELLQSFPDTEARSVLAALAELVTEKLVDRVAGRTPRFRLSEARYRLEEEQPWMGRLDALNHLMGSVADLIWTRFFNKDDAAFSRTVSFRARPQDLERLRRVYEEQVFPLLAEIDARATGSSDETLPLTLSIFWAPDRTADPDADEG